MSKYTTEVRNYCETIAGYTDRQGFGEIENVLSVENLAKIMNGVDYPIFDESYRNTLNKKILLHYYTREIGFETVGLWKLKLKTKMGEIMPYYNQLYKSELIKFNPLYDTDLQKVTSKTADETGTNDSIKNGTGTSTSENISEGSNTNSQQNTGTTNREQTRSSADNTTIGRSNDNLTLNNDTPQGGVEGFTLDSDNKMYLTSSQKTQGRNSENNVVNSNEKNKGTEEFTDNTTTAGKRNDRENATYDYSNNETKQDSHSITSLENYIEKVQGKTGGDSYSSRLIEFRKTFLNIDMMVIDELSDLFMNIW